MRSFVLFAFLLSPSVFALNLTMLRTSQATIQNEYGEEIMLRGVNMDLNYGSVHHDPEAPFLYATEEDIDYLAELGCNSIRMCLHWEIFSTDLGFNLIDTYLSWCEPRGIYLILDLHRVPLDDITGGRDIWNSIEAQDSLCSIWGSIASRYADHPGIAGYDLVNEPSTADSAMWWTFAQRMADTIREVDWNHILFIETPYGKCADFQLINDSNTVYSFHCYDPFTVSHAGASWPGDSEVPSNSTYPGEILTGVDWVGWSSEANRLTERTDSWISWNSGEIEIPDGVELISLKAFTTGNTGLVHFDNFAITINGTNYTVMNGEVEELSRRRIGVPKNWVFYSDGNFTGSFAEDGYQNGGCLEVTGSRGNASWLQTRAFYTAPLFQVESGDIVEVEGMVRALNNSGQIVLGLDYLTERRAYWNSDSLRKRISTAINWGNSNNVPMYVGEFGSLPGAGIRSRSNLIFDWVLLMNEENLHWSYWTYRSLGRLGFALRYNYSDVDEDVADILRYGFSQN